MNNLKSKKKFAFIFLAIIGIFLSFFISGLVKAEGDSRQISRGVPRELIEQEESLINKKGSGVYEGPEEDSDTSTSLNVRRSSLLRARRFGQASLSTTSVGEARSVSSTTAPYQNGMYVIQRIQLINGKPVYTNLGAYSDLNSANQRMLGLPSRDSNGKFINMIVVQKNSLSPMKIVASNNAYVVVWPLHGSSNSSNLRTTTNILSSSLNPLTYVSSGSVGKYNFVKNINGNNYVNLSLSGCTGYVELNKLDIIPTVLIENSIPVRYSNYTSKTLNVDLYRAVNKNGYMELQNRAFNTSYYSAIGIAPDWMRSGRTYYSVDGNYFYNDIYMTSRANSTPYFNYYQYLPFESKSKVTAPILNRFIANRVGSKSSAMKNLGYAFIDGQNKTDTNALLTFSLAVVESASGTSKIALQKNNLFGWKAYDSSPYLSADAFKSAQQAVHEMMGINLKGYTNTTSWKHNGSFLGNKAAGLNVKYASASDWGKIIASIAYRVDQMNGFADYNSYQLARVKDDYSLNLYKGPSTTSGIIKVSKTGSNTRSHNLSVSSNYQHRNQILIAVDNPNAKRLGFQEVKLPNSSSAGSRFDSISGYVKNVGLTYVNKAKVQIDDKPEVSNPATEEKPKTPSIPTTGSELYVRGQTNVRSSMNTSSSSNIVGSLYKGQLFKGTRIGNYYKITYKGDTAYIYHTTVTSSQISAEAFISTASNIRYTSNDQVARVFEKGTSVTGVQRGNKLYLTLNGKSVYVYSSLLTYGIRENLYITSLSNIRNSQNKVIGIYPPGKQINAVLMGNWYRFYEDGSVRFVYKTLASKKQNKIEAFTNQGINIYDYTGSKILGRFKIASYVHGVVEGNYFYFNYNGSSARIPKFAIVSGNHTRLYAKEKVNARDQDYVYQYTINPGESILGLKVGKYYYRFWKDGKIYLAWADSFR